MMLKKDSLPGFRFNTLFWHLVYRGQRLTHHYIQPPFPPPLVPTVLFFQRFSTDELTLSNFWLNEHNPTRAPPGDHYSGLAATFTVLSTPPPLLAPLPPVDIRPKWGDLEFRVSPPSCSPIATTILSHRPLPPPAIICHRLKMSFTRSDISLSHDRQADWLKSSCERVFVNLAVGLIGTKPRDLSGTFYTFSW